MGGGKAPFLLLQVILLIVCPDVMWASDYKLLLEPCPLLPSFSAKAALAPAAAAAVML